MDSWGEKDDLAELIPENFTRSTLDEDGSLRDDYFLPHPHPLKPRLGQDIVLDIFNLASEFGRLLQFFVFVCMCFLEPRAVPLKEIPRRNSRVAAFTAKIYDRLLTAGVYLAHLLDLVVPLAQIVLVD
jgi:hypothetical protein